MMLKEKMIVSNPHGMHARPAAVFAKLAKECDSKIIIINGDKEFEVKGMMSILTAGLKYQSEIDLVCEGGNEVASMEKIREGFLNRFGEKA